MSSQAGLVAVTAPVAFVDPWAAVVIGLVAGLIVPPLVVAVDKIRVDDPIGCLPVHGIAGIWGTLSLGLFVAAERTVDLGLGKSEGLLLGGGGANCGCSSTGSRRPSASPSWPRSSCSREQAECPGRVPAVGRSRCQRGTRRPDPSRTAAY